MSLHASPETAPGSSSQSFVFHGRGSEYCRIWAVNLALTLITFGIYSAWAKVRRLRYFHDRLELAGWRFAYDAQPLKILIGRGVVVAAVGVYRLVGGAFGGWVQGLAAVLLIAGIPLLVRSSHRFRAAHTRYRAVPFRFDGGLRPLYRLLIGLVLAAGALLGAAGAVVAVFGPTFAWVIALALLGVALGVCPCTHWAWKAYQHGHVHWGGLRWRFTAGPTAFLRLYAQTALLMAVLCGPLALLAAGVYALALGDAALPADAPLPERLLRIGLMSAPVVLLSAVIATPFFLARLFNLVWNATRVGAHRIESRLDVLPYMRVWIGNLVLILLTLGLYTPWAAVRLARIRPQGLMLHPAEPIEAVVAEQQDAPHAIGSEALELFDFDLSL